MTCMATYTTTQADMDAGGITNTGTATGESAERTTGHRLDDDHHPAISDPSITLEKSASVSHLRRRRQPGDLQLRGHQHRQRHPQPGDRHRPHVGAVGPRLPRHQPGSPAGSETCTATYTTTQADMDTGTITNTGTATGDPPTGPSVAATSSVTLTAVPAPAHQPDEVGQHHFVCCRRDPGDLQLPGQQHRQRHPQPRDRHRPHARAVDDHLPAHAVGTDQLRDVHRHLHHHPERRGRREHLQHRHRHRDATDRNAGDRHLDGHHCRGAGAGDRDREIRQPHQLRLGRRTDHLQLRGHQQRQRHPACRST